MTKRDVIVEEEFDTLKIDYHNPRWTVYLLMDNYYSLEVVIFLENFLIGNNINLNIHHFCIEE